MRKYKSFREYHIDELKNKKAAKIYLEVALDEFSKDQNKDIFLQALRDVAQAQGGFSLLAQKSNLNRQNLYKALSKKGSPRFDTMGTILKALGFRISLSLLCNKAA